MNGERGRHRAAFVEYLTRIYTGTVDADTLARLCRTDYADLDDAYRRHMAR
jgi:protein involved in temperature-dependent protein secretion